MSLSSASPETVGKENPPHATPPSGRTMHKPFSKRVHHTALAIVPRTDESWNRLNELRYRCQDKGFYRWPPHINLVYPFIEPEEFSDFAEVLTLKLAHTSPFHVTLAKMGTFGGARSGVCWLDPCTNMEHASAPASHQIISNLHTSIMDVLAGQEKDGGMDCDGASTDIVADYAKKDTKKKIIKDSFRPHMTFNHSPNVEAAKRHVDTESADWIPLTFEVEEIYMLERGLPDNQFKIRCKVPLGIGLRREIEDEKKSQCGGDISTDTNPSPRVCDISCPAGPVILATPEKFLLMPSVEEKWVKDVGKALSLSHSRGNKKKNGTHQKNR